MDMTTSPWKHTNKPGPRRVIQLEKVEGGPRSWPGRGRRERHVRSV